MSEEKAHDLEAAREAALRLLERQRRTRGDLERRLKDKGYAPATIATALERLAGVGLVDDVEYAQAFLRERWGRRPAGYRRLEQELRVRGVPAPAIEEARGRLEAERGAPDEVTSARRAVEQAARRTRGLDPRTRRQRLWALLARRGYDGDVIEQVLRDLPDREE